MVSDVAYKTGTMVKDPRDMTDTQRTVWQKQCATDARDYLFSIGDDFALELNLGFPSHYEYLKSIAAVNPANQIHLLLFFTDDLNLCISRAAIRYRNGGHFVSPEVVIEMYRQTIPLFTQHKALFSSVRLVNVTDRAMLEPRQQDEFLPDWITQNDLQVYLLI